MDVRLAENKLPYKKGLELIERLQPVTFNKKGEGSKLVGLIAQDIAGLEPTIVKSSITGLMSIDYDQVLMALVNSVQQLSGEIQSLKAKKKTKV